MASLDILCSNPLNLKNKITKIEHKKIFCGPSKIFKNISWPINICLKYFMILTKAVPPSYALNVRSLNASQKDKKEIASLKIKALDLFLTNLCLMNL